MVITIYVRFGTIKPEKVTHLPSWQTWQAQPVEMEEAQRLC